MLPNYLLFKILVFGVQKLQIYLDTNIIYGFFKSIAELVFKGRKYTENKRLKLIESSADKIDAMTSFFTLVEVVERLKRDYKEILPSQISSLIEFFRKTFCIKIIEEILLTDRVLFFVLHGMGWKDSIQLEIAKNGNFLLITEDKNLKTLGRKFYKSVYDFKGLLFLLKRL